MGKKNKSILQPINSVPVQTGVDVKSLLQNAVNEVLDGVISKKELKAIALRKVRRLSVLTEEEDNQLDKLEVFVIVK